MWIFDLFGRYDFAAGFIIWMGSCTSRRKAIISIENNLWDVHRMQCHPSMLRHRPSIRCASGLYDIFNASLRTHPCSPLLAMRDFWNMRHFPIKWMFRKPEVSAKSEQPYRKNVAPTHELWKILWSASSARKAKTPGSACGFSAPYRQFPGLQFWMQEWR